MNNGCRVAIVLVLAVVFCFGSISMVEAKGPIWQIFKDGTNQSIKWKTHAGNPRFAKWKAGTPDTSDDIVLDRETGLVWERQPSATRRDWDSACKYCYDMYKGKRHGWRLPTIEELASLAIPGRSPSLPTGDPFIGIDTDILYLSSTTSPEDNGQAMYVHFNTAYVEDVSKGGSYNVWCVRGGQGHDAY